MQQNSIWLSISLFCNREDWNILLCKGIKPFVKDASNQLLLAYQLEFNYTSGENIRLKLLTNENNAKSLIEKADNYFKQFFITAKLPIEKINFPIDDLFMPFTPNSIQYGLYPIYNTNNNLRAYQLEISLSILMAEALEANIIDSETIITLGFYLHIGLLKVLKKYELDSVYQDALQRSIGNATSMDSKFMYEEYQKNKVTLLEIYQSIMDEENYVGVSWIETWMHVCEEEIKYQSESAFDQLNAMVYSRFIFMINRHLGINQNTDFQLWHFLKYTLSEHTETYIQSSSGFPDIN